MQRSAHPSRNGFGSTLEEITAYEPSGPLTSNLPSEPDHLVQPKSATGYKSNAVQSWNRVLVADILPVSVNGINYNQILVESNLDKITELLSRCFPRQYQSYINSYFALYPNSTCLQATRGNLMIGCVVFKLEELRKSHLQGSIAYLAVDKTSRNQKVGSNLLRRAIRTLENEGVQEVILYTEVNNLPSLRLYGKFGFFQKKRIPGYYPTGVDAFQLKLVLQPLRYLRR
ncbi:N-acetyltransferase MAK3 protein [Tropilaelaps mercedesae]|uniref:N-acetyltransferase MAK3 protein n=1 Tax=Tropilaelaps mercedesae TaxID=418985 RepID=A0A1V9XQL1_9ACAR|nr:N-acetyltransferase MAK3 protein [Tropilaelaps mercedesae]